MTDQDPTPARAARAYPQAEAGERGEVPSQVEQRQDEPLVTTTTRARQANSNPMTARILIWSAAILAVGFAVSLFLS